MTIKGVLFDIDDTLYSHVIQDFPFGCLYALKKLREKGIKIGVCTSREVSEMRSLSKDFTDLIDCQIIDTGAVAYVKDKYYKSYTLDPDLVKKYIDYFNLHHINYHYAALNGDCCYCGDKASVEAGFALKMCEGHVYYQEYDGEELTNLGFYNVTDKQLEDIKNINPDAYLSLWGHSGHIAPTFVDKSFGVLKFCEIFHFTTDEVMAFGDGDNDDVMLEMAGIGVATYNANQKTKDAANYVCKKPNEEGGILSALIDLKLIDKVDYKAFFYDNDSTLFDHTPNSEPVRESVYEALTSLKKQGKKLCMITSRGYTEMYNVPKKLTDLFDNVCLLSGAYNLVDGVAHVKYIDYEESSKLIKLCDKYDLTYRYCTDDGGGYLNRHDKDKEDLFYRLYEMIPPVKKYEGEKICHFLFYADDDTTKEIVSKLNNVTVSKLAIACEISPLNINKGSSMLEVAKSYGVDLNEICAFGDSGNDVEMLTYAGLGISMGDGSLSAKKACDIVTDTCNNDGIYKALKYLDII